MNEFPVLAAIAALVMVFILAEIAAAVLPLIIVMTLVPPEQRDALARVLAACDSSRKVRLWAALRAAVRARRQAEDRDRNPPGRDVEAGFGTARAADAEINVPRPWYDPAGDQR
jgi:hypothetical protein